MKPAETLELLKYAGFMLAAAATVWGLVQKTTFEDSQGRKRLTSAGYIAIAFALGAAIVGASAYGFETLVKLDEREASAAKERQRKGDEERKDYLEVLTRTLDRAEAAELRSRLANQRSLSLTIAAEERTRQFMIAGELGRRAAVNLSKAETALVEIRRVLQPAGLPTFNAEMRVDGPIALTQAMRSRVDDFAAEKGVKPGNATTLFIAEESQAYPNQSTDMALNRLITAGTRFVFYSGENAPQILDRLKNGSDIDSPYMYGGDYSFTLYNKGGAFFMSSGYRDIMFTIQGRPNEDYIRRSGKITAVQDFAKALLVIYQDEDIIADASQQREFLELRNRLTLASMAIQIAGRTFFWDKPIKKIRMKDGLLAWIVWPVGSGGK
jgi:hypothetical protein